MGGQEAVGVKAAPNFFSQMANGFSGESTIVGSERSPQSVREGMAARACTARRETGRGDDSEGERKSEMEMHRQAKRRFSNGGDACIGSRTFTTLMGQQKLTAVALSLKNTAQAIVSQRLDG